MISRFNQNKLSELGRFLGDNDVKFTRFKDCLYVEIGHIEKYWIYPKLIGYYVTMHSSIETCNYVSKDFILKLIRLTKCLDSDL